MALFHALRPFTVGAFAPEYGGYAHCARAVGSKVVRLGTWQTISRSVQQDVARMISQSAQQNTMQMINQSTQQDAIRSISRSTRQDTLWMEEGNAPGCFPELVIASLPNNPSGQIPSCEELKKWLAGLRQEKTVLVLDICYLPFLENAAAYGSVLREEWKQNPRLLLLSSFTKTFALPGIRFGYLIVHEDMAAQIALHLPEWNVSVVAEEAALACTLEADYVRECAAKLRRERKRLQQALTAMGITVFPSASHFFLAKSRLPLYEALRKEGILLRDCSGMEGLGECYVRLAVRSREENDSLLAAVKDIVQSRPGTGHTPTIEHEGAKPCGSATASSF